VYRLDLNFSLRGVSTDAAGCWGVEASASGGVYWRVFPVKPLPEERRGASVYLVACNRGQVGRSPPDPS
jgi:hypothetical protein